MSRTKEQLSYKLYSFARLLSNFVKNSKLESMRARLLCCLILLSTAVSCPAQDEALYPVTFTYDYRYNDKSGNLAGGGHMGKTGYINASGEVVIPPLFDFGNPFSENVAVVGLGGMCAFIDPQGHFLFDSPLLHLIESEQTDVYLGKGYCDGLFRIKRNGKYGFIDKKGLVRIEPKFDYAAPFQEGFSAVKIDNMWGYIRTDGTWLLSPTIKAYTFSFANSFVDGYALLPRDKEGCYYIDRTGIMKLGPYLQAEDFSDGLAWVGNIIHDKDGSITKQTNGVNGYINTKGELEIPVKGRCGFSIPCEVNDIGKFKEGLLRFQDRKTSLWGYLNHQGKVQIQPTFQDAKDFSEGLGAIKLNGLWGYINAAGEIKIKPTWLGVGNFHGPLAPVNLSDDNQGYINRLGVVVWNTKTSQDLPENRMLLDTFRLLDLTNALKTEK